MTRAPKPFETLAADLQRRIANGDWAVGERLPPVRDLAREYEVAPNTAMRAVAVLSDAGLVQTVASQGSRVVRAAVPDPAAQVAEAVADLQRRMNAVEEQLRNRHSS